MAEAVVREPAAAKLNVFLRVKARRQDGYHEIETLVQPITLADGVEVAHRDEGISVSVTGPRAEELKPVGDNLVEVAAGALARAAFDGPRGARIMLVKNIPIAAGLGGGSADAAATLRALNDVWGLGWNGDRLSAVAAEIGSDVPALLHGGPVLARGRGELVENIDVTRTWWVLVTQPFGVSAAHAYAWWDEDGIGPGPDPRAALDAVRHGAIEELGGLLFNDLEASVGARHREVRLARESLAGAGALGVVMCGSGPTVAGLARDGTHAEELARAVSGSAVGSIIRAPVR